MTPSDSEQQQYYLSPPHQAYYSTPTTHLQDHAALQTHIQPQPQPQHPGPSQGLFAPVYSPQPETDAEADLKRLRNTAASARFRAKKKQREQTLETQAREKKMALERLEARIQELERENRFLKGLILGPREEELKALKRQRDEALESDKAIDGDRKGFEHKDGVGTD
ncbi:regulatory protein cys-3 [Diplocarpon rosae]|nr:regulatory protein cys-3 [Diplocarpon rosae]